jgi:hypothetical protein
LENALNFRGQWKGKDENNPQIPDDSFNCRGRRAVNRLSL